MTFSSDGRPAAASRQKRRPAGGLEGAWGGGNGINSSNISSNRFLKIGFCAELLCRSLAFCAASSCAGRALLTAV